MTALIIVRKASAEVLNCLLLCCEFDGRVIQC